MEIKNITLNIPVTAKIKDGVCDLMYPTYMEILKLIEEQLKIKPIKENDLYSLKHEFPIRFKIEYLPNSILFIKED